MDGPGLLRATAKITNKRGLHARASAKIVEAAARFQSQIHIVKDGQAVDARSIMGLMMLGAGQGSELELQAEGWDAKEALEALAALVRDTLNRGPGLWSFAGGRTCPQPHRDCPQARAGAAPEPELLAAA